MAGLAGFLPHGAVINGPVAQHPFKVPGLPAADLPSTDYPGSIPGLGFGHAVSKKRTTKGIGLSSNAYHNFSIPMILPNSKEESDAEVSKGLFCFSRNNHRRDNNDTIKLCQLRSVSRLNYLLLSPMGRQLYGSESSCLSLLNDWLPFGVPEDDVRWQGDDKEFKQSVVTYHIAKKARMPNVWAAEGKPVRIGDLLGFIVVRHRFQDFNTVVQDPNVQEFNSGSTIQDQMKRDIEERQIEEYLAGAGDMGEGDEIHVPGSVGRLLFDAALRRARLQQNVAVRARGGAAAAAPAAPEYFWRIQPYVSRDKRPPPDCLLHSPKDGNEWTGHWVRVGVAHELYGKHHTDLDANRALAFEAMYPVEDSARHLEAVRQLPQVEVQLHCHIG